MSSSCENRVVARWQRLPNLVWVTAGFLNVLKLTFVRDHRNRHFAYAVVSPFLGALLVTAGALKLQGIHAAPVAEIGPSFSPWLLTLLIEAEICLGAWLIWGRFPPYSWLTALITFCIFAAISGYAGWIGKASCGCFGEIPTTPWEVLLADFAVIFLLAIARPDLKLFSVPLFLRTGALTLAATVLLGVGLATAGSFIFGSPEAALAALRGENLYVEPYSVDLGSAAPGEKCNRSIKIVNTTDSPIRIIGGWSDCNCVTTQSLPCVVGPHSSEPIQVSVVIPGKPGTFNRAVFLWSDLISQPKAVLRFSGQSVSEQNAHDK